MRKTTPDHPAIFQGKAVRFPVIYIGLFLAFFSTNTHGQDVNNSRTVLQVLEGQYGLTEAQLLDRLDAEQKAVDLNETLSALYSDGYGGSWFEPRLKNLVVAVNDPSSEIARTARRLGAKVVTVRHDVKSLRRVTEKLIAEADHRGLRDLIAGVHFDPRKGNVIFEIIDSEAEIFVDQILMQIPPEDLDFVDVVPVKERAATLSAVDGATRYRTVDSTGQTVAAGCSTGFGVQGGFLTAAHCGFVGHRALTSGGITIGTFTGSTLQANLPACAPEDPINTDACPTSDQAIVSVNSPFFSTNSILPYSGIPMRVKGLREPLVGTSVCRYGATTGGPHCGQVTSTNAFIYLQLNRRVQIVNLIRAKVCGDFGDSGGPLILAAMIKTYPAGVFAVGTLTGKAPGGPVGCGAGIQGDTVYAPIKSALERFNATLLTY